MSDAEFEEIRRLQSERKLKKEKEHLSSKDLDINETKISEKVSVVIDSSKKYDDLYINDEHPIEYDSSISFNIEDTDADSQEQPHRLVGQYTAPKHFLDEVSKDDDLVSINKNTNKKQIISRESDYQKRRFDQILTPARQDAFSADKKKGDSDDGRSYADIMRERELEREEVRVHRAIAEKKKEKVEDTTNKENIEIKPRKRRWDTSESSDDSMNKSEWSSTQDTPIIKKRSRWDQTPAPIIPGKTSDIPTPKRSRWDQTPVIGITPITSQGLQTPLPNMIPQMPISFGTDVSQRFYDFSDEELDEILPVKGFKVLDPPPGYAPIRTPVRKLVATPLSGDGGFTMQEVDNAANKQLNAGLPTEIPGVGDLAFFKQEDMKYFGKLMDSTDESELSVEELKERKIMRLLLKIKNGTPSMRKSALRQITDKAREFGAGSLFNQILPLLMERTLEDQERHLLVKVIDRILYKLDDLVRPYVHKILVVIEPLLIDEDYYARVEGREIISNLSKAAGLAHMISTMRPDIDHVDEYVRNTTARAFSVVASALGIPALLPFLKAVCRSKKSWQARHTGVKIVQQIAILMGCAILPHLTNLVDAIGSGLEDEQQKVRIITALAIAALAEAAAPYGFESFDIVLRPLWKGVQKYRGKGLAAFLKATGYIIPLMDAEYANHYTTQIMKILIREFQSPDEEMKKIVLKVVSQSAATDGVDATYLRIEVIPEFFKNFWVRRMALDRRNYRQVVETTVELAQKVGVTEIIEKIVDHLKDESEPYRKMAVETIEKIIAGLGAADINSRLEERLIDGVLYAFQEQSMEDVVMLNGFGTVVNALGMRCKPYLPQIVSTILWRLNNKSAKVRQQSADLVSRISVVMKTCGEEQLMGKLGLVLYEYLGEEYPEVLGSILGALKSIVNVVGMTSMTPPIKDLLPRLTPILRNRHEKVQENTIDLVGRIADRGSEFVSAREWMRICFELLDMLKAHKKGIRRAAVNTFGFIAKAIGPQDVLATLLNNLKVQERQNRVCTTVAIAIVAETCAPFTVLPAVMNEYRVPELNVQNGVLKSLSFLFEYIGEMGKDYIYAVVPLLCDALTDRDQVHRQTAATTVSHLSLGVVGLGFISAIDGIRTAIGPGILMMYILQGLFHPSRKVRDVYWRLYNNMYVQQADSMVPYYPNIEDDEFSRFFRHEMQIWNIEYKY
ncbi:hypothetical protein PMAC_001875 [Pneumocystis sp. 'macacae']|nr:hypothetical protein PMAC_001875 [Pneumocystis sp. 'macacae']